MRILSAGVCLGLALSTALGQNIIPREKAQSSNAAPSAADSLSQDQIRDLIRKAADNDMANDKKLRDYTYVERDEQHNLDGKGNVKSTEIKTFDVMEIYGDQVQKLISKDDKPLSKKEAAKEDEKIQKIIDKRKDESEEERKKRIAKEEKEREDDRKFVLEVADAYNYKFVGIETMDGRENYVVDGEPKPGYEPHMKEAKILPKFRFRAWIDKDETEWKKLDIECIDTVSFGWVLARLHKGSRVVIEQTRVNNEVWLPQHVNVKIDARVALLKEYNVGLDIGYRDYKKFRTDAKIIQIGEVPPSH
jgi:hypothetical protein